MCISYPLKEDANLNMITSIKNFDYEIGYPIILSDCNMQL